MSDAPTIASSLPSPEVSVSNPTFKEVLDKIRGVSDETLARVLPNNLITITQLSTFSPIEIPPSQFHVTVEVPTEETLDQDTNNIAVPLSSFDSPTHP